MIKDQISFCHQLIKPQYLLSLKLEFRHFYFSRLFNMFAILSIASMHMLFFTCYDYDNAIVRPEFGDVQVWISK